MQKENKQNEEYTVEYWILITIFVVMTGLFVFSFITETIEAQHCSEKVGACFNTIEQRENAEQIQQVREDVFKVVVK